MNPRRRAAALLDAMKLGVQGVNIVLGRLSMCFRHEVACARSQATPRQARTHG